MHQPLQLKHTCLFLFILLMLGSCAGNLGKGDKRFEQEQYERAIQFYQQALKNAGNPGEINYRIAESYRMSNRLGEAEQYYRAALDANVKRESIYYYYGLALKANGKYQEAQRQLQSFVGVASNGQLKTLAQKELDNLKEISRILATNNGFEVQHLDTLNTAASEFSPYVLNDQFFFSSTRGSGKVYMGNGEGFLNIFSTRFTNSNDSLGMNISKLAGVNSDDLHDAMATFTPDGRTMVFARGNEGTKKGREQVDLFISTFGSNGWSEPRILSISDPRAWDSSPAFSPDGKTLYFASNRRGSLGGHDIYSAAIDASGRFSTPVNLGPGINTPGNESFVYVSPDGTLYIASDGLPGLGGLDLFRIEEGKPVNLGSTMNSSGDDFGIFFKDGVSGYFSSNREGGKGGDDIYAFNKTDRKQVIFFVDGTIFQRRDGSQQQSVVPNTRVVLQSERNQVISDTTSDAAGKFTFALDSASTYFLVAEKEGFFTARQRITTVGKMPAQEELTEPLTEIRLTATLVLNQIVKEKPIVLENIYYDLDKADIRPDAAAELDKLVQILVDNPRISIELSSHTDVRGSDAYNLDLSQRRAESAVQYIISQGIDPARLTARGYGETRLVVKNATTEEQHQRNRRTEFKVVRIQE
ncbi:hypothetical protein C1N53_18035 [Pontibacter sp. SGAir0037]|nr:hypothetical protein C1N53_18035 [Pontibacter sp. SGAir0037]